MIDYNQEDKRMEIQTINKEQAVYLAEDVQRALGLGKTKTYEFLRQVYITQQPFRVIKIGRVFRVPKKSFDRWLYGDSSAEPVAQEVV
jgi:hypothetical protein